MICDLQWAMINDLSEPYLALRTCSSLIYSLLWASTFLMKVCFFRSVSFQYSHKREGFCLSVDDQSQFTILQILNYKISNWIIKKSGKWSSKAKKMCRIPSPKEENICNPTLNQKFWPKHVTVRGIPKTLLLANIISKKICYQEENEVLRSKALCRVADSFANACARFLSK